MERNFSRVKGTPPRPARSCRNTTPGPSASRTPSATSPSSGDAVSLVLKLLGVLFIGVSRLDWVTLAVLFGIAAAGLLTYRLRGRRPHAG